MISKAEAELLDATLRTVREQQESLDTLHELVHYLDNIGAPREEGQTLAKRAIAMLDHFRATERVEGDDAAQLVRAMGLGQVQGVERALEIVVSDPSRAVERLNGLLQILRETADSPSSPPFTSSFTKMGGARKL